MVGNGAKLQAFVLVAHRSNFIENAVILSLQWMTFVSLPCSSLLTTLNALNMSTKNAKAGIH